MCDICNDLADPRSGACGECGGELDACVRCGGSVCPSAVCLQALAGCFWCATGLGPAGHAV